MRLLPDIVAVAVIVSMAFILARTPKTVSLTETKSLPETYVVQEPQQADKKVGTFQNIFSLDFANALKARNIFAENGAYEDVEKVKPKAKAYKLIGIAEAKEKKGIFRDDKGVIITAIVGEKLVDGPMVARIEGDVVELQDDEEKQELRVFDVPNRQKTILSSP